MSTELKKASAGPVFIGAIFLFVLFAILLRIWFAFSGKVETLDQKRQDARLKKLDALITENDAKLGTYAWLSKDKGVVQLPIDRAEELVLNDLKARPVQASAVKVENPYPFGLQQVAAAAPAASGSSAPAASPAVATPPVAAPAAPAP